MQSFFYRHTISFPENFSPSTLCRLKTFMEREEILHEHHGQTINLKGPASLNDVIFNWKIVFPI